jgi:diguanylate cyclase (GGDEF)-like protein/PAS domain S-box-containing protein
MVKDHLKQQISAALAETGENARDALRLVLAGVAAGDRDEAVAPPDENRGVIGSSLSVGSRGGGFPTRDDQNSGGGGRPAADGDEALVAALLGEETVPPTGVIHKIDFGVPRPVGEAEATARASARPVDLYFGSGHMQALRRESREAEDAAAQTDRGEDVAPAAVACAAANRDAGGTGDPDATQDAAVTALADTPAAPAPAPADTDRTVTAPVSLADALEEESDAEEADDSVADDTTKTSLRAILENVKDAIITVDLQGKVLRSNPAAERVFSCDEGAMRGRNIGELIPRLDPAGPALEALADRYGDTIVDLAPEVIEARRSDDRRFTAEITVSKALRGDRSCFVLCLRDVTDRRRREQALRDSEARYRALVENAPEAIVVLDVERNYFVDANENAAQLFKMTREELLRIGPEAISPPAQADGFPSFGSERGYIERALKGGQPVFEWLHRDAEGKEIPCEVRFIRLPASHRQLIRASIIDIGARKHAENLAYGERRILERVASNAPLEKTLLELARVAQQLYPDTHTAIMLLDNADEVIRLIAAAELPPLLQQALKELAVGVEAGPCGAATSLGRQVVVRDLGRHELWGGLLEAAKASGVQACCSTPIVTAGDRIHGTLAVYFDSARGPTTGELDLITRLTQLAGIAIRRTQDETALRASEARYRGLFENVVDGVYQTTPDGDLLSANPALVRMLGYEDLHELKRAGKLAHHYAEPKQRERLLRELETNGRVRNFEYQLRRCDGELISVLESSRVVHDDRGEAVYHEGTITDITQRKAAERALFEEKERAQVTLKSIGDAVVTADAQGRVEYLNPVAEELTGWERRQAQGQHIDEIVRLIDEQAGAQVENPVLRSLREGRVVGLADNVLLVSRDGTEIAIQDSAAPIQDGNGEVVGAVMVFHDVSHERQLHRKLSYYASHDSLTGLINRREFEERLSDAVGSARREETLAFALLYMDLDQFKVVNDTCGHAAGDLLLRQLGDLLQSRVRGSDVLARLGGDEFAVLLSECSMTQAIQVADDLREAISNFRFSWRDGAMQVGVSIGIVPVVQDSPGVGGLLSAADVACYVAKDLGRNRIHVYQEGDAAERHQEMQWVARINQAREEGRFELFFQPIVPIGSTRQAAPLYELLLRMRDERGALISPSAFIPAAERYNLMPSLDRWVVSQVLDKLVYRGDAGQSPYTLAVNISGTTLNDARFLDFMVQQLGASEVPPGALCFEITETAAIANLASVVNFMNALKSQGCKFALDDFGSGLSSLTYLKNLPVDYVKIDGQFIRNVAQDAADESMVEAIAHMAKALRIQTIAERVESGEVLERLGKIGVSFAQGFFIAVPQSVRGLPVHPARRHASA